MVCPDPLADEEAFLTWLEELGARLPRRAVVFPSHDEYIWPLSRHAERLEPWFIVPFSRWDAMQRVHDKRAQMEAAWRAGVDTPQTVFVSSAAELEAAAAEVPFPAVLKPVESLAFKLRFHRHILDVESPADLQRIYDKVDDLGTLILQERIPGVEVRADRPQLVLAARDPFLQNERAEVVDLVVDALQVGGRLHVEDVAVEAQLEGQRFDGLEHGREGHLGGRRFELRGGAHEDGLRRVDAGAPGGLHLGALVVHALHRVPAGEGDDEPGLEPLGVARERPDVLVVAGKDDGAPRQPRAELLEPGEEGLLVGQRVGADHAGGVARAQADGAGVGVERQDRHAVAAEVADDVEAAGVAHLEDGGGGLRRRRLGEPGEPQGASPSCGRPLRVTMVRSCRAVRRAPGSGSLSEKRPSTFTPWYDLSHGMSFSSPLRQRENASRASVSDTTHLRPSVWRRAT